MARKRLSLIHYDLLRELCESCRRERFHFVPIGAELAEGPCKNCGAEARMADLGDSSIYRLRTHPAGGMIVGPREALGGAPTPPRPGGRSPSDGFRPSL